MTLVYMLQGAKGRYYIGCTNDLDARIARHNSGMVHSTKRLGLPLSLAASRNFSDMAQARNIERMLKSWKNPVKALEYLQQS